MVDDDEAWQDTMAVSPEPQAATGTQNLAKSSAHSAIQLAETHWEFPMGFF